MLVSDNDVLARLSNLCSVRKGSSNQQSPSWVRSSHCGGFLSSPTTLETVADCCNCGIYRFRHGALDQVSLGTLVGKGVEALKKVLWRQNCSIAVFSEY